MWLGVVVFFFLRDCLWAWLFSDLRASIAGKDLPEDIKQRLLAMHEENLTLKESYKTAQEKLTKAKQVCNEVHLSRKCC